MRGFKLKIEWQRKVLKAVNLGLPPERQLPGLTQQVVAAWEVAQPDETNQELRSMILRASELTGSINDFSSPVLVAVDDVQKELEQICSAIQALIASNRADLD